MPFFAGVGVTPTTARNPILRSEQRLLLRLSAIAALAIIADPAGVGGYEHDAPQAFVLVQALLLLVTAGLWFAPGVRPRELLRATPGESEPVE